MPDMTIVVPEGIDTPEGYSLPDSASGLGTDLHKWEKAVETALATTNYLRGVTALSVYQARAAGVSQDTCIKGFGLKTNNGNVASRTDVSRLDVLGLAVSHGVTEFSRVKTALDQAEKAGKGVDVRRAIIRNWAVDENRTDAGLIKALTAGQDKTLQQLFEQAIKSAARNIGRASDLDGVTITDEVATNLEAIRSSMELMTV